MMDRHGAEATPARINPHHDANLAFWARILDASPDELRRAIDAAGPEIGAVRSALAARQLRLDFDALQPDWTTR